MSRIIGPGLIFIRRLYDLSCQIKCLHYTAKLSVPARNDIIWWAKAAEVWNQKSLFYEDEWVSNCLVHLYSDASDSGFAAVYRSKWYYGFFNENQTKKSIAWRELYASIVACLIWGDYLKCKKLVIHSDNSSIVTAVNNGTSKCKDLMLLIRELYYICIEFNFECRYMHVQGIFNTSADALSRGWLDKFRTLNPTADAKPTCCLKACDRLNSLQ